MIYVKLTKTSTRYKAWIVFEDKMYGMFNNGEIYQSPYMKDLKKISFMEDKKWDFQFVGESLEEVRKQLPELWL